MSTPRTDARTYWNCLPAVATSAQIVHADFARELESELSTLKAILEKKDEALRITKQWLTRVKDAAEIFPEAENWTGEEALCLEKVNEALALTPETYVKEEEGG